MSAAFDYVVITASTPRQRGDYQSLLQRRIDAGLYPPSPKFRVYNDPQGGRVGSGGSTLLVLLELFREERGSSEGTLEEVSAFLAANRILILHAGGESRRLPCYVPEGKLFAPLALPHSVCPAAVPPVVLDLLLRLYDKYPWTQGEVMVACGDVILDFDTAPLRQAIEECKEGRRGDIWGFGKATSFVQGSRHGVFAFGAAEEGAGPTLPVTDFHQKSKPEVLEKECNLASSPGQCAMDVGLFSLGPRWVERFLALGFAKRPGSDKSVLAAIEASELYFDFFLECVTASVPGQSEEAFLARMAATGSKLSKEELAAMHASLSPLALRGALVTGALFLHFGTIPEYPASSLEALSRRMWPSYSPADAQGDVAMEGAILLVNCGEGVVVARAAGEASTSSLAWVENCGNCSFLLPAQGFNMLVGLQNVKLSTPLPDGMCLDGRHVARGEEGTCECVAVYGAKDSFKAQGSASAVVFCGVGMPAWLEARGLTAADIWDGAERLDLWTARLFCARAGMEAESYGERLKGYWEAGAFDKAWFTSVERFSLQQLNALDSALEREARRMTFRA